jgi:hypothetical protein
MAFEGGCYCGALRYKAEGEPIVRAQCHCRECQYISGGGPNVIMGMSAEGFSYTKGQPKTFARADLEHPAKREFCEACGTHILTRTHSFPGVIIKVGTLDDPSAYGTPQIAFQTADMQGFHRIPEGIPTFERFPGR